MTESQHAVGVGSTDVGQGQVSCNRKRALIRVSPGSKDLACQYRRCKRRGFDPRVGKIPWRKAWQSTAVFLPGKSHGQRSLVGYSPWRHRVGRDRSDLACTHSEWKPTLQLLCRLNRTTWRIHSACHPEPGGQGPSMSMAVRSPEGHR